MPSLRHSTDGEPGFRRIRSGRGWRYVDWRGQAVGNERQLERIGALVIPPAWRDVWICRSSRGHLQATGTDAAGRKQYLYHPAWREERERAKFERILLFADQLPAMRRLTRRHLRRPGIDREKALATVVQLLDRTSIRIGSEEYAARNGTYGLATLRSRHLSVDEDVLTFDFTGKSGKAQHAELRDGLLAKIVAEMDEMPGYEVFKYRGDDGQVVDVRSDDINDYIKEHMGGDFSAKDFRTWAATVAAAVALDEVGPASSARSGQRAVASVARSVAKLLGNTPAVCRASYIDPRVIDSFLDGITISKLRDEVEAMSPGGHGAHELLVLALLRHGLEDRAKGTFERGEVG